MHLSFAFGRHSTQQTGKNQNRGFKPLCTRIDFNTYNPEWSSTEQNSSSQTTLPKSTEVKRLIFVLILARIEFLFLLRVRMKVIRLLQFSSKMDLATSRACWGSGISIKEKLKKMNLNLMLRQSLILQKSMLYIQTFGSCSKSFIAFSAYWGCKSTPTIF